jgi:hypothetical protein
MRFSVQGFNYVTYLHIVLCEFLCKGSSSTSQRIDSIVDRDLAVLMIQPGVNIFSALLQDLLAKHDGRGRSIDEEVIIRYIHAFSHRGATIVSEMEDPSLNTQPRNVSAN